MFVLAVSSSPRLHGNTDLLLDELLRGLREAWGENSSNSSENATEKIRLAELTIKPCTQCDYCQKEGDCIIEDDMQALYPKLLKADGLFLASPIYFMSLCAQAKLFIDRCQAFWARRYILKQSLRRSGHPTRRGVFIAAGATRGKKVFAGSQETMKWFFDALEMEYWADLLFNGLDAKGAIREHATALQDAYQLGCRIAQTTG